MYIIHLDNYHGKYTKETFHNKKEALIRFRELNKEGRIKNEYEKMEGRCFSFLDKKYNNFYTHIELEEINEEEFDEYI